MAWKVRYGFLPTRLNLSRRDLDIQSNLCANCNKEVESTNHVFFACSMARDLYHKIASWWDINYSEFSSYEEWLEWLLNMRIQYDRKKILEGVVRINWGRIGFRGGIIDTGISLLQSHHYPPSPYHLSFSLSIFNLLPTLTPPPPPVLLLPSFLNLLLVRLSLEDEYISYLGELGILEIRRPAKRLGKII
ncbi:RNA-directed DNA polymerase, eukaryota [Tanacetum coccineum]